MYLQAALITALTTILISVAVYFVGKARGKYQIHAPAITGHPDFERACGWRQSILSKWLRPFWATSGLLAAYGIYLVTFQPPVSAAWAS